MKTFRELCNTLAEANFKVDAKKLQLKAVKINKVDVYYHSEKPGSKKVRVYVKPKGVRQPEELGVYKDIKTAEKSAAEFVKLMGEDIEEGLDFLTKVIKESKKESEEEITNEAFSKKKVSGKIIAKRMMKSKTLKGFANRVAKMKMTSAWELDQILPDYVSGGDIADLFKEDIDEAVGDTSVEDGVNAYVNTVNTVMMKGEFAKQYKERKKELRARAANKYWRIEIFEFGKASSIHAFVDKETGDILKPAGWKAPAKGPRGNVTDPSYISKVSQTRHPQMGGHLYKRG